MSIITSNGKSAYEYPRGGSLRCGHRGCDGEVVRHSLGCGIGIRRCTRCFARQELARTVVASPAPPSRLRWLLNETSTGEKWTEQRAATPVSDAGAGALAP